MVTIPKNIADRIEQIIARTRIQISEDPSDLLPVAFISSGSETTVCGFMFSGQEEKVEAIHTVSEIAKGLNADMIITRTEAWYRPMNNDEVDKFKPGTLSKYPDRKECIMFCVETKEHCWTGIATIERPNGKKTIGEVQWSDDASGLFTSLLRTFH